MASGAPLCTIIASVLLLLSTSQARHFQVPKPGSEDPCIMLDIDFNAEIKAELDGKVFAIRYLTPDDHGVKGSGTCTDQSHEIGIHFHERTMWAMLFRPVTDMPYSVEMFRVLSFVPKEIFGDVLNDTSVVAFSDSRPTYLSKAEDSYLCQTEDTCDYASFSPQGDVTYNVRVNVMSIQSQGVGLKGNQYGPAETCAVPVPGTTPGPVTMVPASTTPGPVTIVPQSSTTPVRPITAAPGPDPPVNRYTVKTGSVTCIALEAAITLVIEYPTIVYNVMKTAVIDVPRSAKPTGSCILPDGKQILDIKFFKGWSLKITFSDTTKLGSRRLENIASSLWDTPAYDISNMTLTLVVDHKRFPDSDLPEGKEITVIPGVKKPKFPVKNGHSDYYQCNSALTNVLTDLVKVKTQYLRFKAFNKYNNIFFGNDATVCSADRHHKKPNKGLTVGLVILFLVLAGFVGLLIMMFIRRNNARYESIQ